MTNVKKLRRSVLLFVFILSMAACPLGPEVPQDQYSTALALSSPTNNQQIYNPCDIQGNYFDLGHSLQSVTIFYTPNYGGITNSIAATHTGGQEIKNFTSSLSISTAGFYYIWAQSINSENKVTISPSILVESLGDVPNTNNYDFIAPLVTISSPTEGQTVSADFGINGSATDNKSGVNAVWIQLDSNSFVKISESEGNWNTNLHLTTTGNHTIRIYATDLSNNVSLTNAVSVNHVAGLPSILISSPQNNLITNRSTINISGTSSVDPGTIASVLIRVNGDSYQAANGTSTWSLNNLNLTTEGTNNIEVLAISDTDISNTVLLSIIRDTGNPSVAITSPANNHLYTSGPIIVSGTASDLTSGVNNVKIHINATEIDTTYTTGNWNVSTAFIDGNHTVTSYATDNAGNTAISSSINITIDTTAPVIIVNTVESSTTNDSITVDGTASDATTGLAGVYLSVNDGNYVAVTGTTSWTKDVALTTGNNTIRIYALDNAGHSSATNTSTVSKSSGNGFTVYFKKPSTWAGAYIHNWPGGTSWSSLTPMTLETIEGQPWYSYTFNDLSITNFLFADMQGTNTDGSKDHQTSDFARDIDGYFWTNGQWYTINPEGQTIPILTVSAPSDYREVTSSTLYVLGTAAGGGGVNGVYVSINGASYVTASGTSSWSYNASLILGTNEVRVYALGNSGYYTSTNLIHVVRKQGSGNNHPGYFSGNLGATLYADGVEFAIWWRDTLVSQVYVKGTFNGWNSTSLPLQHIEGGSDDDIWWIFVPGANAGDEYLFANQSGNTVIDPASKYNRYDGGNSVVVDHSTFNWTDNSWNRPDWQTYAIYELHVKDFSEANAGHNPPFSTSHPGKYRGVIDGLTYLTNMGITAIEIMPPSEFGDVGYSWGYNTALYYAIESGYADNPLSGQGGVDEMKELINACHEYGIAVIFDMVFNHSGGSNPFWAIDEVAYFDWSGDGVVEADSGQPDHTPWGNHFNTKHPATQRYGKAALEYFMREFHVDGFRFDMCEPSLVSSQFLQDAKNQCMSVDPKVFFVFEDFSFSSDLKGYGGHWNDSYHDNGVQLYRGNKNIGDFKWDIEGVPGWANGHVEKVNYFESHDEDTLGYHAFDATYGQGFDSGTAEARSRMASVILATSVGVPMFWMGMENLTVTEGQDTSDGAFKWGTYTGLQSYFAGVFSLRKNHPALQSPNISTMYSPSAAESYNVYAYQRWASGDNVFVVILNSDLRSSHTVSVGFPSDGAWTKVITESGVNGTSTINVSGGSASITIGANSGVIYMK